METTVLPGFTVTDEMFVRAADGVEEHTPALAALTWQQFTDPDEWTRIPDADGRAYKAEMILHRSATFTVKMNVWLLPDRRAGSRPLPHDHPWRTFRSMILLGGYDEDRYVLSNDHVVAEHRIHRAGSVNHLADDVYHEVTAIHDPAGRSHSWCAGRSPHRDGDIWTWTQPHRSR